MESQRSETGQGILGDTTGRGKYDMCHDYVVKSVLFNVGRELLD